MNLTEMEKEKKKINWIISKMRDKNVIGEQDISSARFLLTFFSLDLKEALKVDEGSFFWDNLKKNGFVDKKTNKIYVENRILDTLNFCLLIMGCKGYLKTKRERKKRVVKCMKGAKRK